MPKNINPISIVVTLEEIEKIKTTTKYQQNSLNNHAKFQI